MRKIILIPIFLFFSMTTGGVSAQMLTPQIPSYTNYPATAAPPPIEGFTTTGYVNGWTQGEAEAFGTGGISDYQTYSTGTSDSTLDMNSVNTVYGPDTPCSVGCGDNFAEIHAEFRGKHESGAFSSNTGTGPEGTSSFAGTESFIGLEGFSDIGVGTGP